MNEVENNEAKRLVAARQTLKVVWVAYRDDKTWIDLHDRDVRIALEVALDEIDLALLRLEGVTVSFDFEYRDGNENDSQ